MSVALCQIFSYSPKSRLDGIKEAKGRNVREEKDLDGDCEAGVQRDHGDEQQFGALVRCRRDDRVAALRLVRSLLAR